MRAATLALFAIVAAPSSPRAELPSITVPVEYRACERDADCAVAGDACRSCGTPIVVNKKFLKWFDELDQKLRRKKNLVRACEACAVNHKRLKCVEKSCVFRPDAPDWTTLLDGEKGLENFELAGEANWEAAGGAVRADRGAAPGFLVSKRSYKDFALKAEFWASTDANSGIFLRCKNPPLPSDESCYEANIFDQRPDPTYGTGAIVKIAPIPAPMRKAGGRWNVYEITVRGPNIVLVLNGRKTVDIRDERHAEGPFALQWVQGTIKFRKIEILPL